MTTALTIRRLTSIVVAFLVAAWLGTSAACAAGTLYGIAPFFDGQQLVTFDLTTGVATSLGATKVQTLIGLDADSAGKIYSVDAGFGNSRHLYELSPLTGTATSLFDLGTSETFYEGGFGIDPTTGLGYIVEEDDLYTINLQTGALTPLGNITNGGSPLGTNVNVDGLAFRGGELFGIITINAGALDNHLIAINKNTLAMTDVGSTGLQLQALAGLAYNPLLDRFYLAGAGSNGLYEVDPATAQAKFIGNHGLTDIAGLAFVIPEPSTWLLCLTGLLALGGSAWASKRTRMRK